VGKQEAFTEYPYWVVDETYVHNMTYREIRRRRRRRKRVLRTVV
jgi:hypothetical protein